MSLLWDKTYPQVKTGVFHLLSIDLIYRFILWVIRNRLSFRHPNEIANRMTCITWQTWAVLLASRNLLVESWSMVQSPWTLYMENQMISFFIYDLIVLTSTQRGRRQTLFYIHHFISLAISFVNRIQPSGDHFINNSIIVMLESASPFLNLTKIMEEIRPNSEMTRSVSLFTKRFYGYTRVVFFAPWIMLFVLKYYRFAWNYNIILSSLVLIFSASVKWFFTMVRK
jgi:hypothetical protein